MKVKGCLQKMRGELKKDKVLYSIPLLKGELNNYVGKALKFEHTGKISCIYCSREIRKSYNQGYCFPCFQKLARCDLCILRPSNCHYRLGTCREPEWAQGHCMTDHWLYFSNTSGLKIGLTRKKQAQTRWIDQGAIQALPICLTKTREQAGHIERFLANSGVKETTNWREMLKKKPEEVNLSHERDKCLEILHQGIKGLDSILKEGVTLLPNETEKNLQYPVTYYPQKVKSLDLNRTPVVEGQLNGIKGQYLIFDTGVLNVRRFGGYEVIVSY